jgi:GrpB-like predicted nucleotidyltransferase (UPF0157 family)
MNARPRLVPHDPTSADRFGEIARTLEVAMQGVALQIEHVGSTAVPGLEGKGTLDIAVGVRDLRLPMEVLRRLERVDLTAVDDPSRPWERRFRRGAEVPFEVIIHVVEFDGSTWRDFLAFRDALRTDRTLREEYAALKRRVLTERGQWYNGRDKEPFVARVLKKV